ncbi:MAG TPA: hypothetical protein PLC54_08040, partial [Spirochaetales bacterium]|nr:hypothetical protein [Spirochaetales bacterium]
MSGCWQRVHRAEWFVPKPSALYSARLWRTLTELCAYRPWVWPLAPEGIACLDPARSVAQYKPKRW